MPRTAEQPPMTRTCAILICAGLVYLAVPNLLFLAGWFTPPVATAVGALLVFCVARAAWGVMRLGIPGGLSFWRGAGVFVLLLFALKFVFIERGIVGIFETHGDYYMFRQALFCNMRDAAWPVILPNGKEMSYYLADILPPALLARTLPPFIGQWCIVFWSVLPVAMALVILADTEVLRRWKRWGILAVPLAAFAIRDPLFILLQTHIGCFIRNMTDCCGVDCYIFFCQNGGVLNPLLECIGAFNSVPPSLLAAAILAKGGRQNRMLVPLVYALLLAVAPIACIGLLPLALLFYCRAWRGGKFGLRSVWAEAALPVAMLFLCAVYYLRGESGLFCTLSGCRVGWPDALACQGRVWVAWLLLVLPLAKWGKGDGLFRAIAAFLFIGPFIYLGSPESMCNELWLKSAPAYLLLLSCFWVRHWPDLPKWKYVVFALCLFGSLHKVAKPFLKADLSRYGMVEDVWNGHLNHDHPFLRQSVPPTHEPAVGGILLRHAGESEKRFPGSLLPQAPGCDYSRPAKQKLLEKSYTPEEERM